MSKFQMKSDNAVFIDSVSIAFHCHWLKDGVEHGYVQLAPHLIQGTEMPNRLYQSVLKAAQQRAQELQPPWHKPA